MGVTGGIVVGLSIDMYLQHEHRAEAEELTATTTPETLPPADYVAVIDWDNKERVIEEIHRASTKYGVSYEKMKATVACESGYDWNIQSQHTQSYGQEQSYGVAQWHLPARNRNAEGKVITKEMALDPAQALDAMAYHFSIGNAKAWTCYRELYQ